MLERVTDPGTYQSFQHFITACAVERRAPLAAAAGGDPRAQRRADSRRDELSQAGPTLGRPSRGSTAARWAKSPTAKSRSPPPCGRACARGCWGPRCIVPEEWLTPEARQRAQIPAALRFQEKWRLALTLLRQIRAAGFQVTAVLGDAEFGDNATLRRTLHRLQLPYALGISSTLTVFRGTPAVAVPPRKPAAAAADPPPTDRRGAPRSGTRPSRRPLPPRAWRRVTWRNGTNRPWAAHFAALRVTPAHDWRGHRLAPEVWLLFERDLGTTPARQGLPRRAARRPRRSARLVRLAHHRWAIEQQYMELQGRTRARSLRRPLVCRLASPRRAHRPGLHLAAGRPPAPGPTTAVVARRAGRDHRDSHRTLLRDAPALLGHHAETRGNQSANRLVFSRVPTPSPHFRLSRQQAMRHVRALSATGGSTVDSNWSHEPRIRLPARSSGFRVLGSA